MAHRAGRRLTQEPTSGRRLWRLHTKIVIESGVPILCVEGRLGHAATAELDNALLQHSSGDPDVVIDLSGVDYLSGAALKVFQAFAERQSRKGGRLRLRRPSIAARLALELAGLLALLDSELQGRE